jgi:proteasome lid subunit RPN8/RPN11
VTLPSDEDKHMFSNSGDIHIIVGYPYEIDHFTAYNRKSEPIPLRVI